MKKLLGLLTGFLFVLVPVWNVSATTIIVEDNLADGTYMTSGASLAGFFNIVPELLPADQYDKPYEVLSGYYTFGFQDNVDRSYSHTETSQYERVYPWWSFTDYFIQRDSTDYYNNEYEEVMANVEGQSNYANTTWYETSYPTRRTFDGTDWGGHTYYTQYYESEKGYSGPMSITYELSVDQLQSLSEDGVINYTLSAISGDMIYKSGHLVVELNENPVTSPTPEPTTMLLFGFGLIGLAGTNRKKYNKTISY